MNKVKVHLNVILIGACIVGMVLAVILYDGVEFAIKQSEVQAAEVHKEIWEPLGYPELLQKAEQAKDVKELEEIAEKFFAEKDKYGYLAPENRCVLDAIYYQNKAIIERLKHLTGEK